MTLDELFRKANEKAEGFGPGQPAPNARILINIEGPDSRQWLAAFEDGKGRLAEYAGEAPDATVTVSGDTLLAVAARKMNATMAFLTGKIKVDGDAELLRALGKLWPNN
ncbi:MAG: SCP2 sterol-binding domain-containing protein [Deltaproteobacteria bacterium]|jgi:putative sterol carrier protein|nr:SCP2 sterol-binding domain-containing protein [Deltaproteobacteria bacterium]